MHFPIIALAVLILIWNKRSKFSTLYIEVDLKGNKWRTKNLITVFNWFVGFWIILLNILKTMRVKLKEKSTQDKRNPQITVHRMKIKSFFFVLKLTIKKSTSQLKFSFSFFLRCFDMILLLHLYINWIVSKLVKQSFVLPDLDNKLRICINLLQLLLGQHFSFEFLCTK